MKIAHVTASFPPYGGGTGMVCFYNARELVRLGHDVRVFTTGPTDSLAMYDGVPIQRIKPLLAVGQAPVAPRLVQTLARFDLVHLHAPFVSGAELVSIWVSLHQKPLVVTYHNDFAYGGGFRDVLFRVAEATCRATALRLARRVVLVSTGHAESSRVRNLARRSDRFVVIGNGVDTTWFCPGATADAKAVLGIDERVFVVGFVAALDDAHHYKGLATLTRAIGLLKHLGAEILLLVVGDGDARIRFEEAAKAEGVKARFVGAVAHSELPAYYRAADVVAIPSDVPESFSLVAAEALSCAVPVIASDGPGIRTLIREGVTGRLVPPGHPRELANAIESMIGDAQSRQGMGRIGRATAVERLDWAVAGRRLQDLYGQVLAEEVR